jgi:hypothetical protein
MPLTNAEKRAYIEANREAIEREMRTPIQPGQMFVPFYRQEATMPDQHQPPAFDPLAESQMRAAQIQNESRDIATAPDTAAAWAPPTIDIENFDRESMTGTIKLGSQR